jgi:hypothetical protein
MKNLWPLAQLLIVMLVVPMAVFYCLAWWEDMKRADTRPVRGGQ